MSAEQEFFLYELETTDSGSVGLVLRLAANLLGFYYRFEVKFKRDLLCFFRFSIATIVQSNL